MWRRRIVWLTMRFHPPMPGSGIVLALLLIMPISPLLDRIGFRRSRRLGTLR